MKFKILFCLVIIKFASYASTEVYHTLEDTSGRNIEALILDFNSHAEVVKIQLRNKRTRPVPLSVFSKASQQSIRDWHRAQAQLSANYFSLSINKKTIRTDRYHDYQNSWHSHPPGMDYKDISYEIDLLNKNAGIITDMKMEYCIYYERTIDETTCKLAPRLQGGYWGSDHEELPRQKVIEMKTGAIFIPELQKNQTLKKMTTEVRLCDGRESRNDIPELTGHQRDVKDKVMGIRVRISIPIASGASTTREFSYPTDLIKKTEWPSQDIEPPVKTPVD